MPRRSWRKVSYSVRLRRRTGLRPYCVRCCFSEAERVAARDCVKVVRSEAAGWSAFFGGISPDATRSWMRSQIADSE